MAWSTASSLDRIGDVVMMLHTGRGAALLGLILGVMSLGVPAMAITGAIQWWTGRSARPRIRGNVSAGRASTIILVGSEGGTTWGFAATLHAALSKAGEHVHVAPLSAFEPDRYRAASRIVIMAATYGDGMPRPPPAIFSAGLQPLRRCGPLQSACLGSATAVSRISVASLARFRHSWIGGWSRLLPFDTIDGNRRRISRAGVAASGRIGIPLDLHHAPAVPQLTGLTLISRRDYGAAVQAPAAILRFAPPAFYDVGRLMGVFRALRLAISWALFRMVRERRASIRWPRPGAMDSWRSASASILAGSAPPALSI